MKIALILNANLYCSPYVKIYSKILDEHGIEFDIIAWDRSSTGETGGIFFRKSFPYGKKRKLLWAYNYFCYSEFIKKQLRNNHYDKAVVFGPQVGLFLYSFLKRKYYKKFCFDYRDIFIDQKFPRFFKKFLNMSALNAISSPGFREYLPGGIDYVQSHNLDIDALESGLKPAGSAGRFLKKPYTILTLGSIRDFNENYQVMNSLHNNPDFFLRFIGRPDSDGQLLKQKCLENGQNNVEFIGYFNDEDQDDILSDSDFINIFRPKKIKCLSTFTNRFYYSLIYKKPMLTTKGSIEGQYAERHNLGLALDDCSDLDVRLKAYIEAFDKDEFDAKCNELLYSFREDYLCFKSLFLAFIKN